MIEIKIKRKIKNGKAIRILECKDFQHLLTYMRSYYGKRGGWIVQENPHIVGLFKKRYRTILREK
ncbi:MAG: hypothetical protein M0R17_01780 [Candidatus Omnitrophica bacterium]|jgi:hypothetical protein|nr:hypothetical protein [Candidatus Omnitrophota bacterium]